jgi:hypothetical protein
MEGLIVSALTFILSFIFVYEFSQFIACRGRVVEAIDSKFSSFLISEGVCGVR